MAGDAGGPRPRGAASHRVDRRTTARVPSAADPSGVGAGHVRIPRRRRDRVGVASEDRQADRAAPGGPLRSGGAVVRAPCAVARRCAAVGLPGARAQPPQSSCSLHVRVAGLLEPVPVGSDWCRVARRVPWRARDVLRSAVRLRERSGRQTYASRPYSRRASSTRMTPVSSVDEDLPALREEAQHEERPQIHAGEERSVRHREEGARRDVERVQGRRARRQALAGAAAGFGALPIDGEVASSELDANQERRRVQRGVPASRP